MNVFFIQLKLQPHKGWNLCLKAAIVVAVQYVSKNLDTKILEKHIMLDSRTKMEVENNFK